MTLIEFHPECQAINIEDFEMKKVYGTLQHGRTNVLIPIAINGLTLVTINEFTAVKSAFTKRTKISELNVNSPF